MEEDFQLGQRVLRALARIALRDHWGEITLKPDDLGQIDYQIVLKPRTDPPRLIVTMITKDRYEELGNEGVPTITP